VPRVSAFRTFALDAGDYAAEDAVLFCVEPHEVADKT
jgi:hypothetical protein